MINSDFNIQKLLKITSLQKAQVLAGKNALKNNVSSIMVMEAPDVEKWLTKDQVLLSSLFTIKNDSEQEQTAIIKKIAKYGASALIVKKGRFIEQIPNAIIKACDDFNLPLIEIPNTVKYTTVQIEVMQILFSEKAMMLERFYLIHHKFMKFALTKPPLLTLLKHLKKMIKHPVALLNDEGKTICTTDANLCEEIEQINLSQKITHSYIHYNYKKENVFKIKQQIYYTKYLIKFPIIDNDYHVLVIYAIEDDLTLNDFMTIENAISYFQMESVKNYAISEVKQNYYNDLVDDLLYGKFSSKEAMNEALSILNMSRDVEYIIFVVQITHPTKKIKDATKQKTIHLDFVQKFSRYWEKIIHRVRSNRIIFIIPKTSCSINELKDKIRSTILYITKAESTYYRVGISRSCFVDKFPKYSAESLQVLQLGNTLFKQNYVLHYDDLGIYKVLGKISPQLNIKEIIPSNLYELYQNNHKLMKTLEVYLETNQNLKKSAERLFIHPKTMKYRVNQLEKLLSIDFDDNQQVMIYLFGLYSLKMRDLYV